MSAIAILPFLILSFFNYPVGMHDWDWAVNMVGETDHLNYWSEQKYWYNNAMGRYASTAMLSATNFWFSIGTYKWFSFFQFLFLLGSFFVFTKTLFNSKSRLYCLQIALVTLAIYLHGMQSVFEGFYLLSSNLTYQMAAGMTLLFFAAIIKKNRSESNGKIGWTILSALLLFLIVGMNEISMLILVGIFSIIVLLRFYSNRKIDSTDLILLLVMMISAIIEISAPGNYTRMTYYAGSKNFPLAIGLSLSSGIFLFVKWMTTSLLIPISLFYLSVDQKNLQVGKSDLFSYPKIATALLLLIPIGCLFPIFWSMGMETLPDRVVDTIFLFFVIGWFLMLQSWSNYFYKNGIITSFQAPKFLQIGLSIFILFNLFFSGINLNKDKAILATSSKNKIFKLFTVQSNVGNAWKDLISGEAYGYHLEQKKILESVKHENKNILLVNKLQHQPLTIYNKKYDRKASYGDKFIGHFFGRDCIVKYE